MAQFSPTGHRQDSIASSKLHAWDKDHDPSEASDRDRGIQLRGLGTTGISPLEGKSSPTGGHGYGAPRPLPEVASGLGVERRDVAAVSWHGVPAHLELYSYCQGCTAASDRGNMPILRLRTANNLHTPRTDGGLTLCGVIQSLQNSTSIAKRMR